MRWFWEAAAKEKNWLQRDLFQEKVWIRAVHPGLCRFFGIIFRMWVEAKLKPSFYCEWIYQALVLLSVHFHCFWAEGSFLSLIELWGGSLSLFKVRLFSCFIRSSSAISAVVSEELSHHDLGGPDLSSVAFWYQYSAVKKKSAHTIWLNIHPSGLHFQQLNLLPFIILFYKFCPKTETEREVGSPICSLQLNSHFSYSGINLVR